MSMLLLWVLGAAADGGTTARVLNVGEAVTLEVGESATMRIPELKRAALADPELLDLRVGFEWLDLDAKRPGKTSLVLWTKAGQRVVTAVTVKRPPVAHEVELTLPVGVSQTLELGNATAVETVDHRVATAEVRLGSAIVRAVAQGETVLVVTTPEGKARVPLTVTPPTAAGLAGAPVVSLELPLGATVVLTIDGASEASVSQPSVLRAETRSAGTFALQGTTPGQTLVRFKVDVGTRDLLVRVVAPAKP